MTSAAGAQPVVDFHQHFFHPAETGLAKDSGTVTAKELIEYLDAAKIRRALVLSVAYQFGNPNRPPVENEYAKVRAENDWTSQQVSLYPDRLRGFCGVNPLREYAVKEVERCAADSRLRYGLKLHFGNSDVDLDNPEHVAKLTTVFREADRRGMAIVVHMHASVTRGRPYGARQAQVFLDKVLPATPHVFVQIAHLCGVGGYDAPVDQAVGVFVDAIERHDPRMDRVYFDISGMLGSVVLKESGSRIATRVRQLAGVY